MFIKTKDPADTVEKLHAAVESHPSHALTKDATDRASRVDYVITADDEGRRVSLAVFPVVVRGPAEESARSVRKIVGQTDENCRRSTGEGPAEGQAG
jgi:hypothetical protein